MTHFSPFIFFLVHSTHLLMNEAPGVWAQLGWDTRPDEDEDQGQLWQCLPCGHWGYSHKTLGPGWLILGWTSFHKSLQGDILFFLPRLARAAPKETRSLKYARCYLIESKTPVAYRHFFTGLQFSSRSCCQLLSPATCWSIVPTGTRVMTPVSVSSSLTLGFPGLSCHVCVVETGTEAGPSRVLVSGWNELMHQRTQ